MTTCVGTISEAAASEVSDTATMRCPSALHTRAAIPQEFSGLKLRDVLSRMR